ncbi:hypothetical protein TWF694_000752 [Orbilia ellipsospora]|uniref:DUF6697 domain-containing protein n=1 Tax=Orbilia ellipsospora TaxID=2528407 RepID=A0AAV9XPX1_9PEZI
MNLVSIPRDAVPNLSHKKLPIRDTDLYTRHGSDLFSRKANVPGLKSPPPSRARSRETSFPEVIPSSSSNPTAIALLSNCGVQNRMLDSNTNSTPPTSPVDRCWNLGNRRDADKQQHVSEIKHERSHGGGSKPSSEMHLDRVPPPLAGPQMPSRTLHSNTLTKVSEPRGRSGPFTTTKKSSGNSETSKSKFSKGADEISVNSERVKQIEIANYSGLPSAPASLVSPATYPNNVSIRQTKIPRSSDMVASKQPGVARVTSLFSTDTSSSTEELLRNRHDVQSDKRTICSSGCQTNNTSENRKDRNTHKKSGKFDQKAFLEKEPQPVMLDKASGSRMVSLSIPGYRAKLQENGSSLSPSRSHEIDHDILADKVVEILLQKTKIEVKQEKTPATKASPKKRKRPDTPEDIGQKHTSPVSTLKTKVNARFPSRDRSASPLPLKRKKLSLSRNHDSESDSDEDAFRRTRRRRLAIATSGSNSDKHKGKVPREAKKPQDLNFKKHSSEEASDTKNNNAKTTSSRDSLEKSARKDTDQYRDTTSAMKGSSNRDLETEPKNSAAVASRPTPKTLSRRERQLTQPNDFWFQKYYNHLLTKVTIPKILGSTGNFFSRTKISHYLGGSGRLTAATVSPLAMEQQIHPVKFLMAFSRQFCPINAKKPGEIIVIASVGDFTKKVPSHISSFPVFLQRAVGEYEYMGSYQFDGKIRLFSDKETRELADAPLVEFWVERFFDRRRSGSIWDNPSELGLSKAGVNALAAQLVPEHLKRKDEVRRLTVGQVREYLIKGIVRFSWSFLKPVQYEQKLYNKLSNAKWPVEKRKTTWGALCKET